MPTIRILCVSVLAAIVFGILHDQVTARICVEYFTIGHVRLIDSDSPTVLGFFWGFVATWWVGLPLGAGLAVAARAGGRPKLGVRELWRPIAILVLWMFATSFVAGLIAHFAAKGGFIGLSGSLATRVPDEKHVAFLTAGWAHTGSYAAGIVGGVILWIVTWKRRAGLSPAGPQGAPEGQRRP